MWSTNAKHLARLIMTTVVTTCSRRNLGKSRWRSEAVERLLLAGSGRALHSHLALIKQRRFFSTDWSGFLCVFFLCVFKRAVCESCKCEIETILHQWLLKKLFGDNYIGQLPSRPPGTQRSSCARHKLCSTTWLQFLFLLPQSWHWIPIYFFLFPFQLRLC